MARRTLDTRLQSLERQHIPNATLPDAIKNIWSTLAPDVREGLNDMCALPPHERLDVLRQLLADMPPARASRLRAQLLPDVAR
jgi:hypothetical protein